MMRFPAILVTVLLVCQAGCARAGAPDLVEAVPVSDWPDTKIVSRAGRIYFAGQPSEAALRLAADEGVDLVINLRPLHEMAKVPFDERALVDELGMRYVTIPVTPSTFSLADVDRFADQLDATEGTVLLHCSSSNRC
ncbi:MAG: protein tyrosine phosphatase family protein, partial [Planctomycetota bacterium]